MSVRQIALWAAGGVFWAAFGCAGPQAEHRAERESRCCTPNKEHAPMVYNVKRVTTPIPIDANWDKPAWQNVAPLELTYYMGDKPEHMPTTQARVAYDDEAIYVIFRVEDRYVRAVATKHQDPVCRDSCVEFFFTPGPDVSKGYFNLEMNCGGIMLMHFQIVPREREASMTPEDFEQIEVAHSMPRQVEPEITAPTVWTVEYRLPLAILAPYFPDLVRPAPGVTWRANFYKCGDETSKPHWLTWSYVDRPQPDFHVPESFGTLRFE